MNIDKHHAMIEQGLGYVIKYLMDFQDKLPDELADKETQAEPKLTLWDEYDLIALNLSVILKDLDRLKEYWK